MVDETAVDFDDWRGRVLAAGGVVTAADAQTLACYGAAAERYAALPIGDETEADREAFVAALPDGAGPVLDWGAGPGHDAVAMATAGVLVEATDASPQMVALARSYGVDARCETFDALAPAPRYRGIWANFSLLHAAPDAVPLLIARAANALVPGGVLHIGMKRGAGTKRDDLGRRYVYVEAGDLDVMTGAAGLGRLSVRHGKGAGLSGHVEGYVIHLSRKSDG